MFHFAAIFYLLLGFNSTFFMEVDTTRLSRSQGGEIHFRIHNKDLGGQPYYIMGSVSGTFPGHTLPDGSHLPLNLDWVSRNVIYLDSIGSIFHKFHGNLYDYGLNTAWIRTGPLSCCTIEHVYFCCVTGPGRWGASNVIEIDIIP